MDKREYVLCEVCRPLWATICRNRKAGLAPPKRKFCRPCTRVWYVRYTAKYRSTPEARVRIRAYNSRYKRERYQSDAEYREKVKERVRARRRKVA